jgi:hypothetical protein
MLVKLKNTEYKFLLQKIIYTIVLIIDSLLLFIYGFYYVGLIYRDIKSPGLEGILILLLFPIIIFLIITFIIDVIEIIKIYKKNATTPN